MKKPLAFILLAAAGSMALADYDPKLEAQEAAKRKADAGVKKLYDAKIKAVMDMAKQYEQQPAAKKK